MARQISCENSVSEALVGTKGSRTWWTSCIESKVPTDGSSAARSRIPIFRAHRPHRGDPFKAGPQRAKDVAESILTAIMGRMSAYTGKAVTREQALNSSEDLMPTQLTWQAAIASVATPWQTQLV
jgi:hypothetical protein